MLQKLKKHNCIFLKKTYVAAFIASSKFFFLSSVETAKGSIAESPNKQFIKAHNAIPSAQLLVKLVTLTAWKSIEKIKSEYIESLKFLYRSFLQKLSILTYLNSPQGRCHMPGKNIFVRYLQTYRVLIYSFGNPFQKFINVAVTTYWCFGAV